MVTVPWKKNTTKLVLQERRKRNRHSILSRAWMWLILSILIPLFIAVLAIMNQQRVEQEKSHQDIDRALSQATSTFEYRRNEMEFLAGWIADQESFKNLVLAGNRAALNHLVSTVRNQKGNIFIEVWDKQKGLLAPSNPNGIPEYGEPLSGILESALAGQEAAALLPDSTGRVLFYSTHPVFEASSSQIQGVLATGFYLDDGFVNRIAKFNDKQALVVISNGQIAFSQLDGYGSLSTNKPLPDELTRVGRLQGPTDFLSLETTQGRFEFKFLPLSGTNAPPRTMIGVGLPLAPLMGLAPLLRDPLPFLLLCGLLISNTIGLVYIFGIKSSLQSLCTAMKSMAGGDLTKKIPVERPDEIGDLAGNLERVRVRFLSELENAQRQQENSATIANSMGIAALETDTSQQIVWVNRAAEVLLKESRSGLLGKLWHDLFVTKGSAHDSPGRLWDPDIIERGSSAQPDVKTSTTVSLRANLRANFTVFSSPLIIESRTTGFVHVLMDTTSQEQLLRSRDEFMMHAAHELRAPLAKLKASVELLAESFHEKNWEQVYSMIGIMQRTVIMFQFFVENLIDIGNYQAGHFRVRPSQVEFKRVIDSALDQFQPFARGQSQQIDLRLNLPSPCPVMADTPRVTQVIFNLLSNAVKYGGEGKPVVLNAFVRDGYAILEVTDFGSGIEPEEAERIFQRFYRGKRVEMEGLGVGLGLAIAREIIVQHGGEITVRSRVGEGTTFWFSLPMAS